MTDYVSLSEDDSNDESDKNIIVFDTLIHQEEFIRDNTTEILGLCAGFGAGKTRALVYKAIMMARKYPNTTGLILEPTFAMCEDILLPTFQDILQQYGIKHHIKLSSPITVSIYFDDGSVTKIKALSATNEPSLIGHNASFVLVDEIDTIKPRSAIPRIWKLLRSRNRKSDVNNLDEIKQIACVSTPEGFNWMHDYFVTKAASNKRLIKARTIDNPFLPPSYIEGLRADYTAQEFDAYCNGEFVNLMTNTVYYNFNRTLHKTNKTINDSNTLHIGMDFNISNMAATIHIIENDIAYCVDEIFGVKNTPAMIQEIKRRYGNKQLFIYPDSAGRQERSNGGVADITQLQQAFGQQNVLYKLKHDLVKDRISTVNARLLNANNQIRYYINPRCINVTNCLERQAYSDSGKPDKSNNVDHLPDSLGYFICFKWPIAGRATLRTF